MSPSGRKGLILHLAITESGKRTEKEVERGQIEA